MGLLGKFLLFWGICSLQIYLIQCAEQCLQGKYHKPSPSPENKDYVECEPWRNKTCCSAAFTKDLKVNQTRNLYNHSWHRCKQLSASCERFWVNQECFYQCSPYVYNWKSTKDAFKGVPICASICDRWYDACRDDLICVENVLVDYNFTEHGENWCPKDKPCITYQKMYGSGKALCEKMWGDSYVYTVENSDSSNCMVMWFNGENPNKRVKAQTQPKTGSHGEKIQLNVHLLLFALVFVFIEILTFGHF